MKKLLLFFYLIFIQVSLFGADKFYQDDINSKQAYEKYKNGALIIDVRDPLEYIYAGRIKGHINIPIFFYDAKPKEISLRKKFSELERSKDKKLSPSSIFELSSTENTSFAQEVLELVSKDTSKEIIIICRTGSRSVYAANILSKNGFKNVFNVLNGLENDWLKETIAQ